MAFWHSISFPRHVFSCRRIRYRGKCCGIIERLFWIILLRIEGREAKARRRFN